MTRPSKIDRLSEEIREEIGRLRRAGRTIDEILAHLRGLLPDDQQPSRTAMGRHVQRLERLGERIRRSRDVANALVDRFGEGGETKSLRLNVELMHDVIQELVSGEDGDPVKLDAKQACFLAGALRNLAAASKTDADLVLRLRREIEAEQKKRLEEERAHASGEFDLAVLEKAQQIMGFSV